MYSLYLCIYVGMYIHTIQLITLLSHAKICVCVCECVHVSVCACMCVCISMYACTHNSYSTIVRLTACTYIQQTICDIRNSPSVHLKLSPQNVAWYTAMFCCIVHVHSLCSFDGWIFILMRIYNFMLQGKL